ncbi:MAG TPA: DUF1835 domain-containing protein [Solirubrobacteraceae bacterium]
MAELHVTNGDVLAEAIRERMNVPRQAILPWRDVLHEGPVPAGEDDETLRHTRAAFLGANGWGDTDWVRIDFAARDAALAEAVDLATRVTLWFEDDLYDQLQLIQILDRLQEHNGPIAIVRVPHTRVDLSYLYGGACVIDERAIALGARAWAAFREPAPVALHELILAGTPSLPPLAAALRRHLEQLPATRDGLARTERQALRAIDEGAVTEPEIFLAATAFEEPRFMGDTTFAAWLRALTEGPRPLVARDGVNHTLTDDGRACLAGRADRVALAGGIDRWLGGIHLSGATPAWRWDPEAQAPRPGS